MSQLLSPSSGAVESPPGQPLPGGLEIVQREHQGEQPDLLSSGGGGGAAGGAHHTVATRWFWQGASSAKVHLESDLRVLSYKSGHK